MLGKRLVPDGTFIGGEVRIAMKQSGLNSLKAGDVLGRRYVILRQLREEPCGWVWLAQDRSLEQDVGLKFVPAGWPHFEAAKGVLRREASLALKLRHPYIISVFHYEEVEEGVYLILEPYPGETLLSHLMRLERFRMPVALSLLEQVAQALAFAHFGNEVHQGLNPFHIILADNTVKVANFACLPEEVKEEEEQVSHLELKAYIAPEVLQGEPVTPAANVFSLGVLGFRLTAGSLPYPLTFDEPFPYRLGDMPVDLEEIPLQLQNLLLQCLAPEPEDRFEDAGAFIAALEQRRELWRPPSPDRWFGWTPEARQAAAGAATRMLGRLWEGGKSVAGRIGDGVENLKAQREPGVVRRWLLGLAAFVLFVVVLVWGGRAIFQRVQTAPAPPPAPKKVESPQAKGRPGKAATKSATRRRPRTVTAKAKSPGSAPTFKAPIRENRYQLLVATYVSYDQAKALKKRIRAKKIPATVYRRKSKKKTYYVVKAGPITGKKQAEKTARRLEKDMRLSYLPKVVKIKTTSVKKAPRKSRR